MYEHASFGRRFVALLVDELIFLPFTILLAVLKSSHNLNSTHGTTLNLLLALVWFLYNILFVWKSGSTIGKKLLKLRVVNLRYQRVSLGQAILRETLGKLISGILQLGYLWVLIDKKRQGFHDKIAKTFVVQLDLNKNLIPAENFGVPKLSKVAFFVLFFFFGLPIGFVILLTLIYLFVGSPAKISGNSMYPNYTQGQYYMTNKLAYLFSNPRRGDVVILRNPLNPTQQLIKRVIGLPGDQVSTKDGGVYINGQQLSEPYLPDGTYTGNFLQEGTSLTVPQNQYFVLGDNRERSIDSRTFLLVPREDILAKASFCYWACNTHILASNPISQSSPSPSAAIATVPGWTVYNSQLGAYSIQYPFQDQFLINQSLDILTRQISTAASLTKDSSVEIVHIPSSGQKFTFTVFYIPVISQTDLKTFAETQNPCTTLSIPQNQTLDGSPALFYRDVTCEGSKYFMPLLVYTVHNNILYAITVYGIGDKSLNQPTFDQILSTFKFLN